MNDNSDLGNRLFNLYAVVVRVLRVPDELLHIRYALFCLLVKFAVSAMLTLKNGSTQTLQIVSYRIQRTGRISLPCIL